MPSPPPPLGTFFYHVVGILLYTRLTLMFQFTLYGVCELSWLLRAEPTTCMKSSPANVDNCFFFSLRNSDRRDRPTDRNECHVRIKLYYIFRVETTRNRGRGEKRFYTCSIKRQSKSAVVQMPLSLLSYPRLHTQPQFWQEKKCTPEINVIIQ